MVEKNLSTPTMEEVMDELQSRFLVNLPASEFATAERLFFQIEQCYWFYEDFYADHYKHLNHLKLHEFAKAMFSHCPLLKPVMHKCESMFEDFKLYQSQVPVVGCILLNTDRNKLILVRNWKGTSWSLPRGKVNQGESDIQGARREVLEECGYDVGNTLKEKLFIEFTQNQQRMRMFIAKDVPEDFPFAPRTRKEISLIQWFEFDALPKKTWCVLPFIPQLRRLLNRDKVTNKRQKKQSSIPLHTTSNVVEVHGRATSAPPKRPNRWNNGPPANALNGKKNNKVPSMSITPRKILTRGHFGTEVATSTSSDGLNTETFGANITGFSVEDMFSVNEKLTGQKFVYDGNPHDFGKVRVKKTPEKVTTQPNKKEISPKSIRKENNSPNNSPNNPASPVPKAFIFEFDALDIMACVK